MTDVHVTADAEPRAARLIRSRPTTRRGGGRAEGPPPVRAAGLVRDRPPFRGLRPHTQNVRSHAMLDDPPTNPKG